MINEINNKLQLLKKETKKPRIHINESVCARTCVCVCVCVCVYVCVYTGTNIITDIYIAGNYSLQSAFHLLNNLSKTTIL